MGLTPETIANLRDLIHESEETDSQRIIKRLDRIERCLNVSTSHLTETIEDECFIVTCIVSVVGIVLIYLISSLMHVYFRKTFQKLDTNNSRVSYIFRNEVPAVRNEASAVRNEASAVRNEASAVRNEVPAVRNEAPVVDTLP